MTPPAGLPAGGVALPGSAGYLSASAVFNLAAPLSPAAAVTARSVDDVRAAIDYARRQGLQVRAHVTGHAAPTARPMADALLVRTDLAGEVEVDVQRRLARIPAGTTWGAVAEAAAPHGLAAPHGSSAHVGVVGYLLRGGLSFYGRQIGLAVNSIRAIELVTSDGVLRRVDDRNDPELYWAVRGGGGGFGVVTALEVELFPATAVVTGAAFWPIEHARRLLRMWRVWTVDAPEQATTSLQILRLPDVPEVPAELRAGPVLVVDGAVLADPADPGDPATAEEHANDLLERLRSVAEPVLDTWQLSKPSAVLEAHVDPEDPVPIVGDHLLLGEISDDGGEEFLRMVGADSNAPLVAAGLRQLGGAYARRQRGGGVLSHLAGHFAYSGAGVAVDEESAAEVLAYCARVREALSPWDTGCTVPSFVENWQQPQGHLSSDDVHAVDAVRARVDPIGLFAGDIMPGCYSPSAQNRPGL